ncbi:MAG: Hsp20 family protein [Candidatus Hydrogenedens sp.]|nr:Hsp20 family protein [Candidatus Hydrogenedens sp.]
MSNSCDTNNNACCTVEAAPRESAVTIEPLADVYERESDYQVVLDLPGATPESVEVQLVESRLTVTAEASMGKGRPETDRPYEQVRYSRRFRLAQTLDQSQIQASLKDGVLTVLVPKAEEAKPRRIEVSAN